MDDRRFDAIARALGGATTRRSALGALLGLGLAGTAEAGRKRRKKKCNPECAAGQTCRQGACSCDNGGTACGANCCLIGQRCESGQCTTTPAQCIPAGEACKGVGRQCCDGRTCASGQGGKGDVACYAPAGGACATTADCVFDSQCKDGVCVANGRPNPLTCVPAGQSGCTESTPCCPGSTCLTQVGASSGSCGDAGPSCTPTFAVTGDAAANGVALQNAVAAASTGDTIVLAAGDYRFDTGMNDESGSPKGLVVENKAITINVCPTGAKVRLICPPGALYVECVQVGGYGSNGTSFPSVPTKLSMKGVEVEVQDPSSYGPALYVPNAAVELEDVTLATMGNVPPLNVDASTAIATGVIKTGVSLKNTGSNTISVALTAADYGAGAGFGGSVTCSGTPTYSGAFTDRCGSYPSTGVIGSGCGC